LADAYNSFDDIYFVTSRPGPQAQKATEDALEILDVHKPKVIIASDKPPVLMEIKATHFLDDRDKNFEDCILADLGPSSFQRKFDMFMLDRPWNRHFTHPWVKRIHNVREIL
jgi:hypothetical protein